MHNSQSFCTTTCANLGLMVPHIQQLVLERQVDSNFTLKAVSAMQPVHPEGNMGSTENVCHKEDTGKVGGIFITVLADTGCSL